MDAALLTLINGVWINPVLDVLMVALSTVGIVALLVDAYRTAPDIRQARAFAWTLAATGLSVALFYYLAGRPRPTDVRLLLPTPPTPSFPSGHMALAAATVTWRWLTQRRSRRTVVWLLVALGVGYSRVYLGHHYPTDVIAGAILGAGIGAAGYGLSVHWDNLRAAMTWLLWPQISVALVVTMMAYLGLLPLALMAWPYSDKVLHTLLVGGLAFWLGLMPGNRRVSIGALTAPVAVILPFSIALGEEFLQTQSPLRTFDLGDLAGDLVGLLLFYALSQVFLGRRTAA